VVEIVTPHPSTIPTAASPSLNTDMIGPVR
jgi:hypothetical protein